MNGSAKVQQAPPRTVRGTPPDFAREVRRDCNSARVPARRVSGESRQVVLGPFFLGASRGRSCGRAALQFVRDGSCSASCRGLPLQGQRRPRGRRAEPAEKWPSWAALTREDASEASMSVSRRSRRLSALPHVSSRAASEASGTRLPRWWRYRLRQTAHPLGCLTLLAAEGAKQLSRTLQLPAPPTKEEGLGTRTVSTPANRTSPLAPDAFGRRRRQTAPQARRAG